MDLEQSLAGAVAAVAALLPAAPAQADGFETVQVDHAHAVFSAPGGRQVDRLRARTPYGSRTRLWVRARRRGWLKVSALDAPGHAGWIRAALARPGRTLWRRIVVDRSARRLTVLSPSGRK